MSTPPIDVPRANRWFAVEFNNLAWDLVSARDRTSEQTEKMIHAAHAACLHWLEVGTLVNHLRAQCLLATAYAAARQPEPAVTHAERCLDFSRQAGDSQTSFDRATAHGCAAAAYALAHRTDESARHYQLATDAAATLTDPEDRKVFDQLYPAP